MTQEQSPSTVETSPILAEHARSVSAAFEREFGRRPAWLVAAPGRVNLIGEHTDYNDGFVLPMALDRYVIMAGDIAASDDYSALSLELEELQTFRSGSSEGRKNGTWSNYLRGVVDGCIAAGLNTGPLDIVLSSSVPVGGGLSSSAALEVAMATLVEAASGKELGRKNKAYIAQKAEHDYAGVPCGIMDQFASALCLENHLMLLDCRSAETEMVPFTDPEIEVLIINSNVKHQLSGGEYAERREQCEQVASQLGLDALRDASMENLDEIRPQLEDVLYRRARHVISEIARTREAAGAFASGDWSKAGQLMTASHESLRDDFEVSCPELDVLVELALRLEPTYGVYGSRMTGGGFGGCTVSLVNKDCVDAVAGRVREEYIKRTGIEPSIYVSRPARGAHILEGGQALETGTV